MAVALDRAVLGPVALGVVASDLEDSVGAAADAATVARRLVRIRSVFSSGRTAITTEVSTRKSCEPCCRSCVARLAAPRKDRTAGKGRGPLPRRASDPAASRSDRQIPLTPLPMVQRKAVVVCAGQGCPRRKPLLRVLRQRVMICRPQTPRKAPSCCSRIATSDAVAC